MSTLVDQARQQLMLTAQWLENGCDPKHAATELRMLADRVQELEGNGEPVMIYHGRHTIDCGEFGSHDMEMLKLIPAGTKLYTSPPSSVQPEKERRPLSDEQINAIAREVFPPDPIIGDAWSAQWDREVGRPFARAIEAAHGISPSPSMVGREGE